MPGDYDQDGISDLAVYYPGAGHWYIKTLGDIASVTPGVDFRPVGYSNWFTIRGISQNADITTGGAGSISVVADKGDVVMSGSLTMTAFGSITYGAANIGPNIDTATANLPQPVAFLQRSRL